MALPLFLLGILGGWSVENLGVTVVLLSAGISWCAWRQGNRQLWIPAGTAGAFLGLAGLIAAPGNWVRYGQQGSGKGLLIHSGNQFAGNGEMFLYLLPAMLPLLLVWRILKVQLLAERGQLLARQERTFSLSQTMGLVVLAMLVYFSGGFIGEGIRDALIACVMAPLHLDTAKAVYRLSHVVAGFEEMAIYLVGIFLIYGMAKRALGFDKNCIRRLNQEIRARGVWQAFPEVRFAGVMIGLCFFNNFVMMRRRLFRSGRRSAPFSCF